MESCLFLCLLAITAGAVSAQTYPQQLVNGALGGSVEFNVHIRIPDNRAIAWRTGGGSIIIARILNNNNATYFDRYVDRSKLFPNGTLILDKLTRDDQRLYTVTIESQVDFTLQTVDYQLDVYPLLNAPELRINSSDSYFINGNNMTLQCDAGSQNVTTYDFYRDQKPICNDSQHVSCRGSFLHFQPVIENDSGVYICTIKNPVSTNTSNSLNITVMVPVSSVTLTSNTSGLLWPGIDSVSLHCSARGTDARYSWSLNGVTLIEEPHYQLNQDKSILIISPVSSKDNGSYTCTASNIISNQTSNEVVFNLASNVSAVTLTSNTSEVLWEGDSVCLYCSAQGSAIEFSWSLNGKPVSPNPPYYITKSDSPPNSNLTISPLSRNDAGPFICTATNLANSENSTTTILSLNWLPEKNIMCKVNPNGNTFTFVCSWENGHPAANVTMMFNGTTETQPNMVSRDVDLNAHIGGPNFTCIGEQLGRTSTCELLLEPPRSSRHDNNTITNTTAGEKVILRVTLDSKSTTQSAGTVGILPALFTWYRFNPNKTEIKSGGEFIVNSTDYVSTLSIAKVTAAYSGKYECIASNFIGNESFVFSINVTTKINPPENYDNGLDGGEIAGIVIGVLAGLTIIGTILFFIFKKN